MGEKMQTDPVRRAYWKSLVIAAVMLLVLVGLVDVLFNLPIVTGSVPQ